MQSSDFKKKLFWRANKKDQQLMPEKKHCSGYYWKWTKENADKLLKTHQDSKEIPKSAWNHGTMEFNKERRALRPKYNDFLSDTRSLVQ